MGQVEWKERLILIRLDTKNAFLVYLSGLPKNPEKMVTGMAIGQNTYARSGSIMLGIP